MMYTTFLNGFILAQAYASIIIKVITEFNNMMYNVV